MHIRIYLRLSEFIRIYLYFLVVSLPIFNVTYYYAYTYIIIANIRICLSLLDVIKLHAYTFIWIIVRCKFA